jgi:hypothetical protein
MPIIIPPSATKPQIYQLIFPTANTMLGLYDHFYEVNPYTDNTNPTIAEIDFWNIEVVRHFRRILGNTTPLEPDRCLFLRAQWASERAWSTYWDEKYPGKLGTAGGPCIDPVMGASSSNQHCGASFVPDAEDQLPYLNGGEACSTRVGAEGLTTLNTDIPWSIKISRVIQNFIGSDGLSDHMGPFQSRTRVGFSWHIWGDNYGNSTVFRGKWAG